MNREIRRASRNAARLAVGIVTLCVLGPFSGCTDSGDLDVDAIVDALGDGNGNGGGSGSNECVFSNDGECDDGTSGGSAGCLDNLDRFSGTYSLSVLSRELGIQDHSTEGVDICGPGNEFFGALPTSATISVNGSSVVVSVNIESEKYSASGSIQGPSAPVKPLVGGTFFETSNASVTPGVNSCGVESPFIVDSRTFPEDGGQTTLTVWVYLQEDAVNVVAESFWIADDSPILSRCHGVIILQGTR